MIIRCTKCSTEFGLEASQVGTEGVTLRCSVCAHMFHAEPEPEPAALPKSWRLATVEKHLFELADLRVVVEHILDGRLRPDDQISQTGQHWLKLREIPEFSPLFIGHDLPRVYRVQVVESSELGPPPTFGIGVDEPAPVRREETARFDLGSPDDPLPDPALPTLEEESQVPAPAPVEAPPPRNSRAQRVTGGVSSMLDAVTKAVANETPSEPPPEPIKSKKPAVVEEDDEEHERRRKDKERSAGSTREPILVSDLARAAAQNVAARVQRVDDQRERAAREQRNEPSENRRDKALTTAAIAAATTAAMAVPKSVVMAPKGVVPAPPPSVPPSSSNPTLTTEVVNSTGEVPPRAPEVVIVKVTEPSRGWVFVLVAVVLGVGVGVGVAFGVPSIRERLFNLGAPPPVAGKPEVKAVKVEQAPPEFQAAQMVMRTLGARETKRVLGNLERVIDSRSDDLKIVAAAKLMQVELVLLRVLVNRIVIMLDPANSQVQSVIDSDLVDAAALIESLPAEAEAGVRARVMALLALAQGLPEVKIGAGVPGAREVQALILGAPLWRDREASVPGGLITSLRGVVNPSTLHQSLLALALWRSGDEEGARTTLDGIFGRVADLSAAKALRTAMDQRAAQKGEIVLPPPDSPPDSPPDPVDPTGAVAPVDPTGSPTPRPDPTLRPRPVPVDLADTIDALIKTGCEKVRSNDASGGIKLLMQAVDKRGDGRHFELCMCLGTGFSSQGNHDTALAWFKRAFLQSPLNRDAIAGVARAAELAGKRIDAIEYYRKLLEVEPSNQAARNYLAKHEEPTKDPLPEDPGELMPIGKKR